MQNPTVQNPMKVYFSTECVRRNTIPYPTTGKASTAKNRSENKRQVCSRVKIAKLKLETSSIKTVLKKRLRLALLEDGRSRGTSLRGAARFFSSILIEENSITLQLIIENSKTLEEQLLKMLNDGK